MTWVQKERTGSKNGAQGRDSICVVVVVTARPTVGLAPAAFRSAIRVWRRTCGGLPVAEPIGSALTVARFGHSKTLIELKAQ